MSGGLDVKVAIARVAGGGDLSAGADAAGREHRSLPVKGVDDLRPQHHRADLAGVSTCFMALRDDDVDAVLHMTQRVFRRTGKRSDRHTGRVDLVDDVLGR